MENNKLGKLTLLNFDSNGQKYIILSVNSQDTVEKIKEKINGELSGNYKICKIDNNNNLTCLSDNIKIIEVLTENIYYPILGFMASHSQEWLIFGVGINDYDSWHKYATDNNANLTVFAIYNENNYIPNIILGNFNNLKDLSNLKDNHYDKILFAHSTVKFLHWFGINIAVIARKLTANGILYIPDANAGINMLDNLKFEEVLIKLGSSRYKLMMAGDTKLRPYTALYYGTEKEIPWPMKSLFVGANKFTLIVNESDKRLAGNAETREKYNKFYYEENKSLLEALFSQAELLNSESYPWPADETVTYAEGTAKESSRYWKLSHPIKRKEDDTTLNRIDGIFSLNGINDMVGVFHLQN